MNSPAPGVEERPPTVAEVARHAARYPAGGATHSLERPAGLWLVISLWRIDGMTFPLGVADDGVSLVIVGRRGCAPAPYAHRAPGEFVPGIFFRPLDYIGAGVPWPKEGGAS